MGQGVGALKREELEPSYELCYMYVRSCVPVYRNVCLLQGQKVKQNDENCELAGKLQAVLHRK